ncbi:WYL domain-containing protein [Pseudoalteromonas sp. 10-33]|uniref:WYL domain-containing protein n=1 Tax=Pseudoalteromonas sp. 10-33 TaxID=1761890 RepID=UPI000731FB30|nr:WYL domain-containing protein [Pseudoalteromonas sp. 10-33]KTF19547.1 transcriptional regulator [Pseudoalteromonas sp. 10-33]
MDLEKLNYAQRERLAFIDFCLQFVGQIARADLINHFKTGLASCSRDLTLYKELAPDNLELRHEDKQYYRTNEFQPVFTHNPEAVLTSLCRGFGDGLSNGSQPSKHCFDATRLIHPSPNVIATLMRAINSKKAVRCDYVSLSSGESSREIVPHSIANNGQRWHVRALDRKTNEFRDFVCTRLQNVSEIHQPVSDNQLAAKDISWNNIINVELSVHPSIKHKKAIELDYNMIDGVLRLEVREALLGYLMRQWNVDCTKNASLVGDEYQLWLSNINELENVASMTISPGYK